MKTLRACAELRGANWHRERTYAKSHSTWPLNLDKLSISVLERPSFSLLCLKGLETEAKFSPWKARAVNGTVQKDVKSQLTLMTERNGEASGLTEAVTLGQPPPLVQP